MNNLRSHCHKAELITESSDEGTSFYRCSECQKPCDFQVISMNNTETDWKERYRKLHESIDLDNFNESCKLGDYRIIDFIKSELALRDKQFRKKIEGLIPYETPSESTKWFKEGLKAALALLDDWHPHDIGPECIKEVEKKNYKKQIDKLAMFIIESVPGEPSQSEGAIDTAIRLLKKYIKQK